MSANVSRSRRKFRKDFKAEAVAAARGVEPDGREFAGDGGCMAAADDAGSEQQGGCETVQS